MRTDNPLGELNNVEREKNNKDITLKFDKLTIHIENKVKSLPQQRQLDDYNKDLKNKNEVLVLLSLFPYKGHVPFISYQQIAKWLDKINIEPENKPENGED